MPVKILKYLAITAVYAVIFTVVMLLLNRLAYKETDIVFLLIGGFVGKMIFDFVMNSIKKNTQ